MNLRKRPNNGSSAISKDKLNNNIGTEKKQTTTTTKTWSMWSEKLYNVAKNYEKRSDASYILANLMNNQ